MLFYKLFIYKLFNWSLNFQFSWVSGLHVVMTCLHDIVLDINRIDHNELSKNTLYTRGLDYVIGYSQAPCIPCIH
jgi:hypothetical protein